MKRNFQKIKFFEKFLQNKSFEENAILYPKILFMILNILLQNQLQLIKPL